MVLNSQNFSPGAVKHFRALIGSLQNQIKGQKRIFDDKFTNISYYYQQFLNSDSSRPCKQERDESAKSMQESIVSIDKEIKILDYDKRIGLFISELKQCFDTSISTYAVGSFLHGSFSTIDYTGYSDIDAGIIVKDEVMLNSKLLKEFKKNIKPALKIILKYDNLQHHGFFIIPEGFFNCYSEDYLPLEVFKHSRILNKPLKLKINSHRSTEYAKKNFLKMAGVFSNKSKRPRNLYEVKHFLSQFMLLPTLYLQAKGEYVYKKFSFDLIKKEFSDGWWVMDEISKIRQDWIRPESKLFNTLLDTLPNPWVVSLIYRKLNWKIPGWLSRRLNPRLYDGMSRLACSMLQKFRR